MTLSACQLRRPMILVWISLLSVVLLAGCKTDALSSPQRQTEEVPVTSFDSPAGIDVPNIPVADRTEVDLVEELLLHRAMYTRLLEALATYYTERGNDIKAAWARTELHDLRRYVKPYRYILDAEVPAATLRPTESIAEANKLYDEAWALMRKGGHGVAIFYNEAVMKQALVKFKNLIDQYPTSDKIDDAAFWIGKIHKEYFQEKDNTLAIEWYKRSIDWNPQTTNPARFEIAVVYDYRLHERENALQWYQRVIDEEGDLDGTNTAFAYTRIRQLTAEQTRYAPGEAVSQTPPPPDSAAHANP
ncbi:MAG: hypothetical protein GXY55_05150 [Phycisphaerae bacterium]|nr:hypothetical protein [Phycisphaerae bacterium]